MLEVQQARSRMEVKGLREINVRAMTSASSLKTSSSEGEGKGEGVQDSSLGMSDSRVPYDSRSRE